MKTLNEGMIDFLKSGHGRDVNGGYLPNEWFKAGYDFARQWNYMSDPPEYYVPVIVDLGDSAVIAWRAWSETAGDIYTINGTDVVLKEKSKRWSAI